MSRLSSSAQEKASDPDLRTAAMTKAHMFR